MQNPFLVGERLHLRHLERTDAPILARYLSDPTIWRSLALDGPVSLREEEELIERAATSREEVVFGIALRQQPDRLLGATGLQLVEPTAREAQFGIFIGDPAEWDKGYGTEATGLLLRYAFETLDLARVWLRVFEDNARGIRAYEKVGFRAEGVLREAVFRDGRYHDLVAMGILLDDWKAGLASG